MPIAGNIYGVQAGVPAPTLTVAVTVVNDNNGTLAAETFQVYVDGNPVSQGVPIELSEGAHALTYDLAPGYSAGLWAGDADPDGTITLAAGQSASASIAFDDIPPLEIVQVLACDAFGCSGGNQPLPHIKVTAGKAPLVAVGHRLEIYLNGDIQVGDQLRFTIVNSENLFWSDPGTSKVTTKTVFAIRGPEITSTCNDPGPPAFGFVHWEEMSGSDFLNVETGVPQDTKVRLKVENLRSGEVSVEKDTLTVKGLGFPATC